MKHLITLCLLLLLALAPSACRPATDTSPEENSAESLRPIRLPMGYIPDPQYAPFYVAADKGYFAAAGFDVTFDYSFETDGIALVGVGELPFAIVSGEQVILARAADAPVVYVMAWFQRYPIAVVAKADSGITAPQDLRGRHVGLPGFFGASYVGYVGLLSANGLAATEVNADDIGFTQYEAVRTDQVEAAVVYINNEPVRLTQAGETINVISVADYINLVANGVITNETMLANEPEVVQAFVGAILRGLADTLADPAGAFTTSRKFVEGLEDDRRAVLEASLPLWQTARLGYSDPAAWENTQALLLTMGLLDKPLADLSAAYSNAFVTAAP